MTSQTLTDNHSVSADGSTPAVELDAIGRDFGALTALQAASLRVFPGEVVAIVGDNGAGKSTLIKMIGGVLTPTRGRILLDGQEERIATPAVARRHGIEVIYQDLALADEQPIYMNMFLGRELQRGPLRRLDRRRMTAETRTVMDDLGIRIPSVTTRIRDLSGGQRQGVAIGRAMHWARRLVLMDEPTAALGVQETRRTEELILRMRDRGQAIIIVSHSLDQVFRVANRICVLRRGEQVGVRTTAETTGDEIVSMITGLR